MLPNLKTFKNLKKVHGFEIIFINLEKVHGFAKMFPNMKLFLIFKKVHKNRKTVLKILHEFFFKWKRTRMKK